MEQLTVKKLEEYMIDECVKLYMDTFYSYNFYEKNGFKSINGLIVLGK